MKQTQFSLSFDYNQPLRGDCQARVLRVLDLSGFVARNLSGCHIAHGIIPRASVQQVIQNVGWLDLVQAVSQADGNFLCHVLRGPRQ
jgi:hypothetical protein